MLGLQHLDVPHLRGRFEIGNGPGKGKETIEGTVQVNGKVRTNKREDKKENEAESTKEVDTSEQDRASYSGS